MTVTYGSLLNAPVSLHKATNPVTAMPFHHQLGVPEAARL